MKWKCMTFYVNIGQVKCTADGHRPHVTLSGVAAHDVQLSTFLPSSKRLWNSYYRNKSISFDDLCCIGKPVVYRVQYHIHFATGQMLKPK